MVPMAFVARLRRLATPPRVSARAVSAAKSTEYIAPDIREDGSAEADEIFGENARENAEKAKAAILLVFILRFMDRRLSVG
jgi:hypothetical protein